MRVFKYGESVLKKRAQTVAEFNEELKKTADDMFALMLEEKGLGLAAPQVGVSKRIFIIDMRQRIDENSEVNFTIDSKKLPVDICMPIFAVNPEIEAVDDFIETAEEGCLSFPGIYAPVDRAYRIVMKYQDLQGVRHELFCEGLFARCVQHEYDHLEGVCFVERLSNKTLFKIETKLRKLKKQTKDFLKTEK